MGNRLLALARIGLALLVVAAIGWMIYVLVGERVFNALNFFTFFTILSNLYGAAVLFESGRRQLVGAQRVGDLWRGASVVYLGVTFIVFAVLLRDAQEALQTHVGWVDSVLHRVMPVVVMADWLIDPTREPIPFRRAVAWVAFPVGWTAFTLVRGAIDGRYPYPFLDPANGGYGVVALYVSAIFGLFAIVIWAVARTGTRLRELRAD
jgi:hypothetical protein